MKTFDPDMTAGEVPSPCIGVCSMHAHTGLCNGCFRTLAELAQWSTASDTDKRAIWRNVLVRQNGAM